MKHLIVIVVVGIVVVLSAFSYGIGKNTDAVALTYAIKEESTLDEIQQLRENGRSPLPLICGTAVAIMAFLVVFNLKEINKVLRSIKALDPFQKRRNGRSRNQPYAQQLPQTYAQPQLPSGDENEQDF